MSWKSASALAALLVLLSLALGSCGGGKEAGGKAGPEDEAMREAREEAWKAVQEAELLMQGAEPGTDLSDARELLDQARALYEKADSPEQLTGKQGSVLSLAEEAKRAAREAMEATPKQ
jgi:hypothetical protein